ncbi:hypothetical protein Droror1_Dr00002355 [Drosera rotundifolia]
MMIGGILCFLAASISSAGGIGGGGLYIPILTIVSGLDLKTATSFSSFMVTTGSFANIICILLLVRSSKYTTLIDFDIVLSSEPFMLLGVGIGVTCNVVTPQWLITALFVIFLTWSTYKTCRTGFRQWKLESEARNYENGEPERGMLSDTGQSEEFTGTSTPISSGQENPRLEGVPLIMLTMLVIIWLMFFLIYVLRGNQHAQSIVRIEPCGAPYWILTSLQIPLALTFTIWALHTKDKIIQQEGGEIKRVPQNKLILPTMVLLAGTLGGFFGIGGGMLISPLLLQIGIPPQVTAATCSFMVFFSSTMSSLQYMLLGVENTAAAAILASICFMGSLLGFQVARRAIEKHGRASLIVFLVGTVMALSVILVTSSGASDVWKDLKAGTYMGFHSPCY